MNILWDEPKRAANLEKHGIDFADIDESFFAYAIVRPAKHGRYSAIGRIAGIVTVVFVTVIFAAVGTEAISIISARPASVKERKILS